MARRLCVRCSPPHRATRCRWAWTATYARYAAPTAAQSGNAASIGWVFGRAAIAAAHASEALGAFSWTPAIARAPSSGDMAFTIGWVFSGAVQTLRKYFPVWQKQDSGEWLYVVD